MNPKLHVINLNLLPNSVFKNPFYDFHSMFQQLDPSVRSTLHRVAFTFVDWQYHTTKVKATLCFCCNTNKMAMVDMDG